MPYRIQLCSLFFWLCSLGLFLGISGRVIRISGVITCVDCLLGILDRVVVHWVSILIKLLLLLGLVLHHLLLVWLHRHRLGVLRIGKLVVSIVKLILWILGRGCIRVHHHHLLLVLLGVKLWLHLINWRLVLHLMVLHGTFMRLHHNILHLWLKLVGINHWSWILLLLMLLHHCHCLWLLLLEHIVIVYYCVLIIILINHVYHWVVVYSTNSLLSCCRLYCIHIGWQGHWVSFGCTLLSFVLGVSCRSWRLVLLINR